jgi:hypothetical protein
MDQAPTAPTVTTARARRNRVLASVAAAVVIVGAALGFGLTRSSSKPTSISAPSGSLASGLSFYANKTIKLIAPDAPGGGFDAVARAVAPYMASYLHATVDVTNDSSSDTLAGQDLFAASPADGLTIGMLNAGTDIESIVTGTPGVNFNPKSTQFLGGNPVAGGSGFECLATSGFANFEQVVHSSTPVSEAVVSSGTQTLDLDLINAAFGIKTKIIGGYANTAAEEQGEERGDGNCGVLSISTPGFGPYMAAGKANLLLQTHAADPKVAFYAQTTKAASLQSEMTANPATTNSERLARAALVQVTAVGVGHEFNAPANTPAAEVTALRAALKYALQNPKCQAVLLAAGQPTGWVSGTRASQSYDDELAALRPVAPLIAGALGL